MDGGWSWVVCGATFFTHMLTIGFTYAIGLYYVEFLSVFNESKGFTALISSLNLGMLCGIAPVASIMIQRWGHRLTMFIGGIIAALGLFICSFAKSLIIVILSFGVITGLGSGLAFQSAVVVISVYFMRLRPLALGISLSGIAVGNIVFPWLTTALLTEFGWRGTLLITCGLLLHICVCALLIIKQNNQLVSSSLEETKSIVEHHIEQNESFLQMTAVLFSDVHYILLLISHCVFFFGAAIVYTHLLASAKLQGMSSSLRNLMISFLGFALLLGRITLSILSQYSKINTIVLYTVVMFLSGFFLLVISFWCTPVGMLICSVLFGFFSGSVGPLLAKCACLITGIRLFRFGYGILSLIGGFGWLLGAPAAGALFDATHHYPNSFYLGGGVSIFGALVMIPVAKGFRRVQEAN